MYASPPKKVRARVRRRSGLIRKGKMPVSVLREQEARRRLQAYQFGAYDNTESAMDYETGAQFYGALQEEQFSDDDLTAGGLGFKIKLKLPKFIRKMKPLKVLGKAAKIAAPIVGVATGGILLPAAIGAGGSILQKGKKVKLFKDVVGSAAVGAGGGVARRVAPTAFRFLKKGAGGVKGWVNRLTGKKTTSTSTLPPDRQPGWEPIVDIAKTVLPAVLPSAPEIPDVDTSQIPAYTPPAGYLPAPMPTYQPTETAAAYTPPGDQVPGETPSGEPPKTDFKKLLVPAAIAAALLL